MLDFEVLPHYVTTSEEEDDNDDDNEDNEQDPNESNGDQQKNAVRHKSPNNDDIKVVNQSSKIHLHGQENYMVAKQYVEDIYKKQIDFTDLKYKWQLTVASPGCTFYLVTT